MKKFVFATLMCVAAMSAKSQVLTSETVNNAFETMIHSSKSNFAYNVEMNGKDITTMYVYKVNTTGNGLETLKQHMKYDYTYAADGTLTSKVTYVWNNKLNNWICAARYDYTLGIDKYTVEYSRYNHRTDCFDKPVEKIVYSLIPFDNVNNVTSYHREDSSSQFQLVSEMQVIDLPLLFAEK